MANPFFSGRIPTGLLRHIEQYQETTGESKTEILIQSLASYTGYKLEETEKTSDNPLQKRVKILEKKVREIEESLDNKKEEAPQLQLVSQVLSDDNNIFTTQQVCAKLPIKDEQLKYWKKSKQLPKEINGYTISFSHKGNNQNYYKVEKQSFDNRR